MGKAITVEVPDGLVNQLPKSNVEIRKILELGLGEYSPKKLEARKGSVVDETYVAVKLRSHKDLAQIMEETKYGTSEFNKLGKV